jgi:hypothetical protein
MKKIGIGISFDIDILEQIDKARGDIPRSKYIVKLLKDNSMKNTKEVTKNKLNSLESKTANLYSNEFTNQ